MSEIEAVKKDVIRLYVLLGILCLLVCVALAAANMTLETVLDALTEVRGQVQSLTPPEERMAAETGRLPGDDAPALERCYLTEEKRAYRKLGVPEDALPPYLLDCDLPEDGAAVLIALPGGQVCLDACEVELDEELDEFVFGLLHNGEWDDVAAWAYVPKWRG